MVALAQALNVVVQIGFVLLALATLASWIRHRDSQRTYLVLALISLTILSLLDPVTLAVGLPVQIEIDLAIIIFLLSGYFLLLFRDSLVPLGVRPKAIITTIVALVAAINIVADVPTSSTTRTPFQVFAFGVLVLTWILCVAEPIFRLGIASIGRPAVEGARLRALSLGYAGLVAVVVIGTAVGSVTQAPRLTVASDVVVLIVIPMLYASFSPPAWLRRIWANPEQEQMRRALHDLLLFSTDRKTLAARALEWATRLVGGAAAFIVDSDGSILATRGITDEAAQRIAERGNLTPTVSAPLDLAAGPGRLAVISGPFTPVFGEYEVSLLHAYAVSLTAGLDRVSLTERIADLEKAKGEFLNLASHELRAPMTVIKGYLTMMAGGTLGEMPERFARVLPMLVAKSDEVISLIEQMIEASRLEEGRLALKKETLDIAELTQDAIDEVQPMLTENRVIEYDRPDRPVMTNVDPYRYQIVVRNLLSNAIKYSPSGADVEVRLVPNGKVVSVEVTDRGIGIAKEDQQTLFTRFGRIESKATTHIAGTGLGLWLSREIARMHDGDLKVDSAVGKGSTFTLEIPLANHS